MPVRAECHAMDRAGRIESESVDLPATARVADIHPSVLGDDVLLSIACECDAGSIRAECHGPYSFAGPVEVQNPPTVDRVPDSNPISDCGRDAPTVGAEGDVMDGFVVGV